MSDRILEALGAKDEHEGLRLVEETSKFLTAVHEATGREQFSACLAVIKSAVSLVREVETITGSESASALGTILAWKSASEQNPQLQAKLDELQEEVRKNTVSALIKRGKEEGKLTPATASYFESRPAGELEAFLAVAPRVIPGDVKQPKTESVSASPGADGIMRTADGKAYEDLKPAARVALKKSDLELYNAIRSDWEKRGKPSNPAV